MHTCSPHKASAAQSSARILSWASPTTPAVEVRSTPSETRTGSAPASTKASSSSGLNYEGDARAQQIDEFVRNVGYAGGLLAIATAAKKSKKK